MPASPLEHGASSKQIGVARGPMFSSAAAYDCIDPNALLAVHQSKRGAPDLERQRLQPADSAAAYCSDTRYGFDSPPLR